MMGTMRAGLMITGMEAATKPCKMSKRKTSRHTKCKTSACSTVENGRNSREGEGINLYVGRDRSVPWSGFCGTKRVVLRGPRNCPTQSKGR
jgi:hypothetical protein